MSTSSGSTSLSSTRISSTRISSTRSSSTSSSSTRSSFTRSIPHNPVLLVLAPLIENSSFMQLLTLQRDMLVEPHPPRRSCQSLNSGGPVSVTNIRDHQAKESTQGTKCLYLNRNNCKVKAH